MTGREIPTDILDSLEECFPPSLEPDKLGRIIFKLTDAFAEGVARPYIRSLQAEIRKPGEFRKVAKRMVEDTKTDAQDLKYRQCMNDVWDIVLKYDLCPSSDGGREWAQAIPRHAGTTVPIAFLKAVSRLSPEACTALYGVVENMSGPVARHTRRDLATTRSETAVVMVALCAVVLAPIIIVNIRRWWRKEISGKRCVKNIIDNGVSVAAGLGGAVLLGNALGVTIGAFGGPVGMGVGLFAGAIIGGAWAFVRAKELSDMLTQSIFQLPPTEALENAYNFLGVSPQASNSQINSRYRHLCRINHPDKGGNTDDWTRLQYWMAIIREARGEEILTTGNESKASKFA